MDSFWSNRRVLVTGASGFLGSNLVPLLKEKGVTLFTPTRKQYDLMEQAQVRRMFAAIKPDMVFHLAAVVGGILANKRRPADFFYPNLIMNALVINEAYVSGVKQLVTCICGCSYPAMAPNPIGENALWTGYPQAEGAPYSLAKAMTLVQAQAYRTQHGFNSIVLLPGNMYGPHDNFSVEESHVIPGLVRKFWDAKRNNAPSVTVWGSGKPTRDFVYVKDVAHSLVHAAETYNSSETVNISSGQEVPIKDLVNLVARLTGFKGQIIWDSTKPDGQARKLFDVTRMKEVLNFSCPTSLEGGLKQTIDWFAKNYSTARL